jgi:hypothetical protein
VQEEEEVVVQAEEEEEEEEAAAAAGEVRARESSVPASMQGRRLARAALQWWTWGEEAGERRWRAGTREEREAAREREARAGGGH